MPGRDAHVRRMLFRDNARNAMVVRACRSAYDKGRFIVVFSDYIDHLERLYEAIRSSGIPARDLGMYIGTGVSKRDLDLALGKRVILATYGKMGEGTSIPWLDTCILAGPRADVIQPVGRIRREYENKQQPVVIDLVDDDSFVYKNYAESRARWYRSIDAEIKDCSI
jgi:superfamily II DNA or RNA helicase